MSYDGSYITASNATTVYTLNSNGIAYTVAVGTNAGQQNQGQNSIAIGSNAGQTNQTANSIVLNAQSTAISASNAGLFVAPIANAYQSTASSFNLLGYGQDNQVVQSGVTFTQQQVSPVVYGEWIQLQLVTPVSITSYVLQYRNAATQSYFPLAWSILGSTDGFTWILLDTQVNGISTGYTLKSASAVYSYFRIVFNQINSATAVCDISGFVLYSNGQPLFAAPSATSSLLPYTVSGTNNNILSLNSITVCTVTWSWLQTVNLQGIINDGYSYLPSDYYCAFSFDNTVQDVLNKLAGPTILGTPVYNTTLKKTGIACLDSTANTGGAPALMLSYTLALNTNNGFSISFWMNATNSGTANLMVFQIASSSTGYGYEFTLNYNNSSTFYIVVGISGVAATQAAPLYNYGTWYYISLTFSGSNNTVYVNGTNILSATSQGAFSNSFFSIVGGHNNSFSYKGYLDDFRVYNRVITATDMIPIINNSYYNPALLPVPNNHLNTAFNGITGYTYLGFTALNYGSSYEYNSALIAVQGANTILQSATSTTTLTIVGPTTISGALVSTVDAVAQGLYLMPSAANSATILSYFQKVVSTVNSGTTLPSFWQNQYTFGSGPAHGRGGSAFSGSILAPNGNVYMIPTNSTYIGIYNPTNNTYTNGANFVGSGSAAFHGGILLPNGIIIFASRNWANIGIYNPLSNEYKDGPAHGMGGDSEFIGGVVLPNGNALLVPCNSAYIGIYNTNVGTFTLGPAHGMGGDASAFSGGVLLPNGNVVFVPSYSTNVGIYDYKTNTYTNGPAHGQGTQAFSGGVLLPNGNVVLVPYVSANIGIYNPTTNTYTQGPAHGKISAAFIGGALLPSGIVVFSPFGSANVGFYNPYTNTYIDGPAHGQTQYSYYGCTILPNGNVIFMPWAAANIGILSTSLTTPTDMCVSPYFNKF